MQAADLDCTFHIQSGDNAQKLHCQHALVTLSWLVPFSALKYA